MLELLASHVAVVLIGTSHPGNIGAVARAMKNMGLAELRLVQPRTAIDATARVRAAAAADIVAGATPYATLAAALADCHIAVGTSARHRRIVWPLQTPRALATAVMSDWRSALGAQQQVPRVALVFGREDRGMTNAELGCCQSHVHIPADNAYPSLNLAQAVLLLCYELRLAATDSTQLPEAQAWDRPLATHSQYEHFYAHLERTLAALDYFRGNASGSVMLRFRRLFARQRLDATEIGLMRGIFGAVERAVPAADTDSERREAYAGLDR